MKNAVILVVMLLMISCSTERKMAEVTATNTNEIEALAKKLFNRHFTDTNFMISRLDDWEITRRERRLLTKKLKSLKIYLKYKQQDPAIIDSIVVFTRGGIWVKEHTLFIDMRKKPRGFLSNEFIKISDRIYYRTVKAMIPIS